MLNSVKAKIVEWLIVGVVLGGLFYAATTAWKNEEKLTVVGDDVKTIKRSMISLLLDAKPDKSAIVKDLISDATVRKGIESFNKGNYKDAYAAWSESASKGNKDSIFAIVLANKALKTKLEEENLSKKEKTDIEAVLKSAPDVGLSTLDTTNYDYLELKKAEKK